VTANKIESSNSAPSQIRQFIAHQPARAKVDIARKADKLVVEIKDFISQASSNGCNSRRDAQADD